MELHLDHWLRESGVGFQILRLAFWGYSCKFFARRTETASGGLAESNDTMSIH